MSAVSKFAVVLSVLTFSGAGILSAEPYYSSYGNPYPYPPAYAAPYPAPVVSPPVTTVQPQLAIPPGSQVYVVVGPNARIITGPRRYGPALPAGWVYARPANCGEYRYWNGWVCLDARDYPPDLYGR